MHLQLQALACMALALEAVGLPHAGRLSEPQGGLTFSLTARKANLSNGTMPSKTLEERSGIVASVVPSPSPADDYGYLVPIQVGSQNFEIKIDTGSEDL